MNAPNKDWASKFVTFRLGPDGQQVMSSNGFGVFSPGYAVNAGKMPGGLRAMTKAWPTS